MIFHGEDLHFTSNICFYFLYENIQFSVKRILFSNKVPSTIEALHIHFSLAISPPFSLLFGGGVGGCYGSTSCFFSSFFFFMPRQLLPFTRLSVDIYFNSASDCQ